MSSNASPMQRQTFRGDAVEKRCYRPYQQYKDSGIEWFEEVPECWHIKQLR